LPVVVHGFAPTTKGDLATLAGLARRYSAVPLVISQLGGLNWLTAIELVRDNQELSARGGGHGYSGVPPEVPARMFTL
jgi:hypothetical protein